MLGEFISRGLVMILGYAYPAFQCFKTLESNNRADNNDLRFWCQYWIIVALLSVCERFGDVFISWMPLYEELKLAFIIYLWSPRTRGTSYVYETLLRPLVSRHETDIDKHLKDLRLRAWDLAIYYWQNCTELGQGAFVQVIQYLLTQSQRLKSSNNGSGSHGAGVPQDQRPRGGGSQPPPSQPPPPPMDYTPDPPPHHRPLSDHITHRHRTSDAPPSSPRGPFRRWPPQPSAPPMPQSMLHRSLAPLPNSIMTLLLEPDEAHTQYIHVEEYWAEPSPDRTNHSGYNKL